MQIKNTYKVHAFTMQELLIGLVISSLIIGMMYTLYDQINKKLIGYNKNQQEIMLFNQFKQVLHKDVSLSRNVEQVSESEFKVSFIEKEYMYKRFNNKIIRDRGNGLKDTFNLSTTNIEIKGDNVSKKALFLKTKLLGEEVILFEEKNVSNATYINSLYLNEY